MHIFRKHQKWILFGIILFIGIPMMFFGLNLSGMGSGSGADEVLATVGGIPIYASRYRQNLDLAASRLSQGGVRPTYVELDTQGIAKRVLDELIDSALIRLEEQKRGFNISQSFLVERLQRERQFLDSNGAFDPVTFNQWVEERNAAGLNWNAIYDRIGESISRQLYMNMILASANRVLDKDVERELEDSATKIQVKYIQITPPAVPTEEHLQTHYENNSADYENRFAEFVAVPLNPDPTEKVLEIQEKLASGADFSMLANELSDLSTTNGGEIGWQTPQLNEPSHRVPLFNLGVGEVSEPVYVGAGFYIYTVEEDRLSEETQEREVNARQIFIKASLSAEDKTARTAEAEKLAATAATSGDLSSAAAELGLTVQTTGTFTTTSTSIENIDRSDVRPFLTAVNALEVDAISETVIARANIYVAKRLEGKISPLAEVRDRVLTGATATIKQSDEYKQEITAYAEKVKAQASTITEATSLFPGMALEVKETKEFTFKDNLFQDGIYLSPQQIYATVGREDLGTMGGPLQDFLGGTFFVELSKRTAPTEDEKANWDTERKPIELAALQAAQSELLVDYRSDLRVRLLSVTPMQVDTDVQNRIFGYTDALGNPISSTVASTPTADSAESTTASGSGNL